MPESENSSDFFSCSSVNKTLSLANASDGTLIVLRQRTTRSRTSTNRLRGRENTFYAMRRILQDNIVGGYQHANNLLCILHRRLLSKLGSST
jgi:hypothetical protein